MKQLFKHKMKQCHWVCLIIFTILFAFSVVGCDFLTGITGSKDATIKSIKINGVTASNLGTPESGLGFVEPGTATIGDGDVSSGSIDVLPTDSRATWKIVKFSSENKDSYENEFATADEYNDEMISADDFFVIEVTAENGDKLYYRINVVVTKPFTYELMESNVEGSTDFSKVKFFLSYDAIDQDFYNTTTYEEIIALFGDPITSISNENVGAYLYVAEFSAAGSGTLLRISKILSENTPLTGVETADSAIKVTLIDTIEPPTDLPSATFDDITVTATVINADGVSDEAANAEIIITLSNAKVSEAIEDEDVDSWFSEVVEGLQYTANASKGSNKITIIIEGTPAVISVATDEITIPSGIIVDDKAFINSLPLEASGTITYNITQAETTVKRTRYIATPASEVPSASKPNPEIIDFKDSNYWYYMIYLGQMEAVPLQTDSPTVRYSGIANDVTFTTTTATAETIEEQTSYATSTTEEQYGESSVNVTVGAEVNAPFASASVSVEAGFMEGWNKSESETWENSYTEAVTTSEQQDRSVTIPFDNTKVSGYYRYVLFGSLDVYALVMYNISTQEYAVKTISDVVTSYYDVDYSPSSRFDDQEPAEITFDEKILETLNYEPTTDITPELPIEPLPEPLVTQFVKVFSSPNNGRDKRINDSDNGWDYITANFDVPRLKAEGYTRFSMHVSFDVKGIDDGYQVLWINNGITGAQWNYGRWDHGGNGLDEWWGNYNEWGDVFIDNWNNNFTLHWGAEGDYSDDWYLGRTTVTVTAVK
ncbi:MAG: hypothetical protein LBV20_03745 [Treponema sp.]|jgi:hypothetical protein|nr:hypothetical protein [Treponema sp.]